MAKEEKKIKLDKPASASVGSNEEAESSRSDSAHPHKLTTEQINNLKPGSFIVKDGKLIKNESEGK